MSLQDDRRDAGGQRVPFEALVVVATQGGGQGAYECEAVDVSEHGMHLRTAYLPELGQPLTFRFDTGSGEVVAEATVLWRDEQAKGGEFGVRFTKMDGESLKVLQELCGIKDGEPARDGAEVPGAPLTQRGSRVRLHIEGLGSPMRARVRESQSGEVMVGSNLEFLRVGRPLELEEVDAGSKRAAIIDKVEVEVDKETKIPQLVVTLRYEGAEAAKAAAVEAVKPRESKIPKPAAPLATDDDHPTDTAGEARDNVMLEKAKSFAAEVGPRLASFGKSARGAFAEVVSKVRQKRKETEDDERPRRMTSPPPDGALHASGRHVVRAEREEAMDDNVELEEGATGDAAKRKKMMMAVAAAGFLVTLLVVIGVKARGAPPGSEGAPAASADVAATNVVAQAAPPAGASGDAVTANVPLFGATPLSTTEPAPVPAPDAKPQLAGNLGAAAKADDGEEKPEAATAMTFGKGKVGKPRILKLKMDAPITDVKGAMAGNAVTITLPGRRNVEPATVLSKRDKRIASVKAVPKDDGVDVTVTFKEGIPGFLAKANGKVLEIDLDTAGASGGDEDGESHAKKGSKKKHAVAKKGDAAKGHKKDHVAQKKKSEKAHDGAKSEKKKHD
jgi:hypothetical protein